MTASVLHIPVAQLRIPQAWRVGRVTFRPPGWSDEYTSGHSAEEGSPKGQFLVWARQNIRSHPASTAAVHVRRPEKNQDAVLEAVAAEVRDALAVLLLYQRARYPLVNTDIQQFGLYGEIGSVTDSYTVTEGRRIRRLRDNVRDGRKKVASARRQRQPGIRVAHPSGVSGDPYDGLSRSSIAAACSRGESEFSSAYCISRRSQMHDPCPPDQRQDSERPRA